VWRAIAEHITPRSGYFPYEWKRPRVVSLLKGPDKDRSDPAFYRGIYLLLVFCEVLEGIMVNRLKDVLPDGSRWQFGFREGRCVEDAWRHIVSTVAASPAQNMLVIFVDFKGAWIRVDWDVVMRRLGCREASLWRSRSLVDAKGFDIIFKFRDFIRHYRKTHLQWGF